MNSKTSYRIKPNTISNWSSKGSWGLEITFSVEKFIEKKGNNFESKKIIVHKWKKEKDDKDKEESDEGVREGFSLSFQRWMNPFFYYHPVFSFFIH